MKGFFQKQTRTTYPIVALFVCLWFIPELQAQPGSWAPVTASNPSTATRRHESAFVQAGDKFYMMGGRGGLETNEFNYVTNTWVDRAAPPFQMHHFQAVTYNGLVYIIGAFTGGFPLETPVSNVYVYDPVQNLWIAGPAIPSARRRGSCGVVMYNNEFYLLSGIRRGHRSGWVTWTDKYNPATNTWTVLADAPIARDHIYAAEYNGKVYLAGGRQTSDTIGSTFDGTIAQVDVYDILTNTWSTLPSGQNIPTPRAGAVTETLGNLLIVAGGESPAQNPAHNEVEALNMTTNTWTAPLTDMLQGRHATQFVKSNNNLYTVAGSRTQGGTEILVTDANFIEKFSLGAFTSPTGTALTVSSLGGSASTLDFGQVGVGNSANLPFTLTVSGGNQAVMITGVNVSGANYSVNFPYTLPIILPPGGSVNFNVTLNETSPTGSTGTLSFTTAVGTNAVGSVSLISTGPTGNNLLFNAGGNCTDVQIGGSATRTISLSASGGSPITFTQPPFLSVGSVYSITTAPLPTGVTPPASAVINVSFNPVAGGTFLDTLVIFHNGTNSPTRIPLACSGADCNLPAGFLNADIGAVGIAGSVCEDNGQYTIQASGADIWGTNDEFHYVYTQISGDVEIIAQVNSLVNTNSGAMAGLMFRKSTAANSQYAMIAGTPANRIRLQRRQTTNSGSNFLERTASTPRWLRMVRIGNDYIGYHSSVGASGPWTLVDTYTVVMPDPILVGLAVTSRDDNVLTTAVFSNLSLSGAVFPVEWGNVSATLAGEQVNIAFSTLTERNNSFFTVEKSADGNLFREIGIIPSQGDSDSEQTYSFTDPLPFRGENIYRIRQTDLDGNFTFSSTVEATYLPAEMDLYPNPVGDARKVTVALAVGVNEAVTFNWISLQGQLLRTFTPALSSGWQEVEFDLGTVAPGAYALEVVRGPGKIERKLVIVR